MTLGMKYGAGLGLWQWWLWGHQLTGWYSAAAGIVLTWSMLPCGVKLWCLQLGLLTQLM